MCLTKEMEHGGVGGGSGGQTGIFFNRLGKLSVLVLGQTEVILTLQKGRVGKNEHVDADIVMSGGSRQGAR